jgi:hypothetical protein
MSGYTIAWLLWLSMLIAIEGTALANKVPGDTLSEHVWKWASVKDKSVGWRLRRAVLVVFLVWLAMHLISGGQYF